MLRNIHFDEVSHWLHNDHGRPKTKCHNLDAVWNATWALHQNLPEPEPNLGNLGTIGTLTRPGSYTGAHPGWRPHSEQSYLIATRGFSQSRFISRCLV